MIYTFNNYQIDPGNFTIDRNGKRVEAEPRVFDLLIYLIENESKVVTRDELFEVVKRKLSDELREEQRKDYPKYQKMIDSYEKQDFHASGCKA